MKKIPVILHTDIGDDADDSWALAMLLRQEWIDLKYILADTGDLNFRAKMVAKMLESAGRSDIPIGLGVEASGFNHLMASHVADYRLEDYPGKIEKDGVSGMIERVRQSENGIALLSIGPAFAVAEALDKAPDIAEKCDFAGMFGSIQRGYDGADEPHREYNVFRNNAAAKKVFSAPWRSARLTPLDSCGVVRLEGENYAAIRETAAKGNDPLIRELFESVEARRKAMNAPDEGRSSVLFDTVAAHLVSSTRYLIMETLNLAVDDNDFTVIDNVNGRPMDTATGWTDLPGYCRFLTDTLLNRKPEL